MSKPKRVEVWMVVDARGVCGLIADPESEASSRARRFDEADPEDAPHRAVRLVELPPGSVVVTREEARVVRKAYAVADSQHLHLRPRILREDALMDAVMALRATKGRKKK